MTSTKKLSAVFVASLFLLIPASAFADTSTTTPPATTQANVQLIADVNLQDCTYTQSPSANQLITISCAITNKLGNQGDIRYGVQLLKRDTSTQEVMDTKVYSQVLSLRENQTIQQQIEYIPPSYLQGEYELWGVLETSDGMPLSSNFLGKVTLKATTPSYFEIKSDTCSLRVTDEVGTTTYAIQQGVDIDPNETIEGTCVVAAHTEGDTTAIPSFVTYRRSVFGDVVSDTKDIQKTFSFKKNETKVISFILPKASAPQSYDAVLSLASPDGKIISNDVAIHYVLRGPSATIQNVLLDKNYYTTGDTAKVSVFWTGSADSFMGARKQSTLDTAKSLVISIEDGSNNSCAKETAFAVPVSEKDRNALTSYPLPITRLCVNPQVTIKITDAAGAILGQKTTAFESGPVPENIAQGGSGSVNYIVWSLLALLVVIAIISGAALVIRNRRNTNIV